MQSANHPPYDVAIVGGGPAGLAAALIFGRIRRRVLLLDADDPAHGVSDGVHGFFGHDGTPPLELRRIAREQLRAYESVTVRMVTVEEASATPTGFSVLADGTTSEAGVLLLATGMRYELPPIEGIAEVWAHGAYHCPYCHGWEVRDQPLAVYGAGVDQARASPDSLSDDVVLLTDGSSDLDPADAARLREDGRHDPRRSGSSGRGRGRQAGAGRLRRRLDRRSHRALLRAELHTEPASSAARMRSRRVGRGTRRRGWRYERSRSVCRRRRDGRKEGGRARGGGRIAGRLLDHGEPCPRTASGVTEAAEGRPLTSPPQLQRPSTLRRVLRARSSVGERSPHTREVAGSNPAAPTRKLPGNRQLVRRLGEHSRAGADRPSGPKMLIRRALFAGLSRSQLRERAV